MTGPPLGEVSRLAAEPDPRQAVFLVGSTCLDGVQVEVPHVVDIQGRIGLTSGAVRRLCELMTAGDMVWIDGRAEVDEPREPLSLLDERLIIDTDAKKVTIDGVDHSSEAQAFVVLGYLVRNREKVMSVDEIIEGCWGRIRLNERRRSEYVRTYIRLLRKKLGEELGVSIQTSRGFGYMFTEQLDPEPYTETQPDVRLP
jgi:DNA-binding winged helix-turn-helix (wHTH) protein